MVALGNSDLLGWCQRHLDSLNARMLTAWLRCSTGPQNHLVKLPGPEWRRVPSSSDGRAVLFQPFVAALYSILPHVSLKSCPNSLSSPFDHDSLFKKPPALECRLFPPASSGRTGRRRPFVASLFSFFLLLILTSIPNSLFSSMDLDSLFKKPPGQEWRRCPPAVVGRSGRR